MQRKNLSPAQPGRRRWGNARRRTGGL